MELHVVIYTKGVGEEALVGVTDNWATVEAMIRDDMDEQETAYADYETSTVFVNQKAV